MRSARRATIRQHEALGPSIQHASRVPIAGIGGRGAFQGSNDATVSDIIASGGWTIARPIGRLNRWDQGRFESVLNWGSGLVRL